MENNVNAENKKGRGRKLEIKEQTKIKDKKGCC